MDKKAKVLAELIEKKGYSRRAFAEKTGIPATTLQSMLTRGIGRASVDNVIKICKGLGITVEEMEKMAEESSENVTFNNEDEDIFTKAAHKVGHEGPLTEEEKEKIALAIKIALAKNNK